MKKHPRNLRVNSADELDTMSENNFRGIALVRFLLGITLKISGYKMNFSNPCDQGYKCGR